MSSNSRTAGTSRSCLNCRAKRKRCDLRNPCQRCISGKLSCSGPVQGAVFVNSSGNNLQTRSHRTALHSAIAARRHVNEVQATSAQTVTVQQTQTSICAAQQRHCHISNFMTNTVSLESSYRCLLEDFQHTAFAAFQRLDQYKGVNVHSDIALCMQTIVSLASAPSTTFRSLDLGIFSLLNLYIGGMCRGDANQIDLARRSYVTALQELRHELEKYSTLSGNSQAHLGRGRQTFCLCLALIFYELLEEHELNTNLDTHIDGALDILRSVGPAILDSTVVQRAFSAFRGMAYSSAARRRLSVFLDEPRWVSKPFDGKSKQRWERLYDIALKLPRLLQRTDMLKCFSLVDVENVGLSEEIGNKLLQDFTALEHQLLQWYQEQSFEGQCGIANQSQSHDLSDHSVTNQASSSSLLHLATVLLELQMGLSDVFTVLRGLKSIDQPSQAASDFALVVSDGVQYLTQHKEGRLIASVPAETLERYFLRSSNATHQSSTAEDQIRTIYGITTTR